LNGGVEKIIEDIKMQKYQMTKEHKRKIADSKKGKPSGMKGKFSANPVKKSMFDLAIAKPHRKPIGFMGNFQQSKKKSSPRMNMNYTQAKRKFPKLSPFGDADKDGYPNVFDCKPFNKRKHMAYKYDDGGRNACGFQGKSGDCFLRAYAITEGKNYAEARKEMEEEYKKLKPITHKRRGAKKPSRLKNEGVSSNVYGVYTKHAREILSKKGYTWTPVMGIGTGTTMHVKEGELPQGKNILRVSKHFIASEGQDWKDSHNASRGGTRAVYGYYHKEGSVKPEKVKEVTELKPEPKETSAQDIIDDKINDGAEKDAQDFIEEDY